MFRHYDIYELNCMTHTWLAEMDAIHMTVNSICFVGINNDIAKWCTATNQLDMISIVPVYKILMIPDLQK